MAKVTVYRFEYFDRPTGRMRISDDYATAKAIREIGAVLLPETAMEVDACRVGVHSGYLMRSAPSPEGDRRQASG